MIQFVPSAAGVTAPPAGSDPLQRPGEVAQVRPAARAARTAAGDPPQIRVPPERFGGRGPSALGWGVTVGPRRTVPRAGGVPTDSARAEAATPAWLLRPGTR
jgi:hypothetical protein